MNSVKLFQRVGYINKEWIVVEVYKDSLKGMCCIQSVESEKDKYCVSISKLKAISKKKGV